MQLTALDLSGCIRITDASVIALSNGCPQLTYLDLNDCNHITDASVNVLSQSHPNLDIEYIPEEEREDTQDY